MMAHVVNLAQCGPRHPASVGDIASTAYLLAQAETMGINGWTMPAAVNAFTPGPASLQIDSPCPRTIECLPQDRSGATAPSGVSGRMVYAGLGRPEDYVEVDAAGAIVLQEIWGLHMTQKVANAHAHGAAGCVWIHDHPGGRRSAWGLGAEQAPLPVVSVAHEDGRWLQELCAAGHVDVTLRCFVQTTPATSDNVLLRLPAAAAPVQGPVLLVAHRDTTHVSPGANDNASGCAVVLEVLRKMQVVPLPFDLIGLFTTAEEGGGIGIRQIATRLAVGDYGVPVPDSVSAAPAIDRPSLAFDLDMLAVGGPMRLVTGSAARETTAWLNDLLRRSAAELGYYLEDYICPMGLADAGPLLEAGIPTTWLFKPDDPRFHTTEDLPQHVNANDMKVAADVVCRALAHIGGVW